MVSVVGAVMRAAADKNTVVGSDECNATTDSTAPANVVARAAGTTAWRVAIRRRRRSSVMVITSGACHSALACCASVDQRSPLDALRRALADFDDVIDEVERVDGWGRPTPCDGWVARDVVAHLADWTPFLLEAVGRNAPDPDDPVVERWRYVAAALQSIMVDPAEASIEIETGPPGRMPVGRAIPLFVTGDVVVHTWDLARAIDLYVDLDEVTLGEQLAAMEPMEAQIRASEHFGPRIDVPADASVVDRALAFTGRDPSWQPPG